MTSSRKRSSHRGFDEKSTLHLVTKRQNRSAKSHYPYTSIPTKKMHASSKNLSLSSIPSILVIILAYLTITAYSIPVQHTSQTSDPTPSQDASHNSENDTSSNGDGGLDGTSNSPDKMEVMNWILAAISIVIVVELIFWLFKCVNMVRRGASGNEENGANNNGSTNRPFDITSNGPDDEYLPPYDGLSLPKYCEAMEMSNTVITNDGNGELRSSPLTEDESSAAIVTGQEGNEGHDERVEEGGESDAVEISRINNQTSTVVVEMNQVTTIVDGTEQSPPTDEVFDNDGSRTQET